MSEEIKNNEEVVAGVEEQPTTPKRGRKPKEETNTEKTYSADEVNDLVQKAVAEAMAKAQVAQPTYIRKDDELVSLLYMGACVEGSTVKLWEPAGVIQGRGGMLDVPKTEFLQNMNPNVLKRLKDRRLIVINGLSDSERERYGLAYSDGELISRDVYYKLLDYSENKVVEIFKKACYRHKQLIASLYMDAYNAHDNRINQPLIQKLNKASKAVEPKGMFTAILKDMAKALTDDGDGDEA